MFDLTVRAHRSTARQIEKTCLADRPNDRGSDHSERYPSAQQVAAICTAWSSQRSRPVTQQRLTTTAKAALIRNVRIGLVGCVKNKLAAPAVAQDLYVSQLFRGRRWYVEQTCDRWFIMSALHNIVGPDDFVAPYDATLVGSSREKRRRWARTALAALDGKLGSVRGYVFEIHAGSDYRDFGLTDGLLQRGALVVVPTLGLTQGRQLAFYANARKTGVTQERAHNAVCVEIPPYLSASKAGSYYTG